MITMKPMVATNPIKTPGVVSQATRAVNMKNDVQEDSRQAHDIECNSKKHRQSRFWDRRSMLLSG